MRKKVLAIFIAAVLWIVTTMTIGYLTVEPITGTFVILAGLSVAVSVILLLVNLKVAICFLIVPITIFRPLNFALLLASDPVPIRMLVESIDIIPIVIFTCFLLHRSIIKKSPILPGEKILLTHLDVIFFLLAGLVFLSALWSPNIYFYLSLTTITFTRILMYLSLSSLIKTAQDIKMVVKTWLVMSVVVVVLTIVSTLPYKSLTINKTFHMTEWVTVLTGFQSYTMRGDGTAMEKTVSTFMTIGTFLCLFLLSETDNMRRKLLLSCLAISFTFSALIAQAKSNTVGLFFGILFLTLAVKKLRKHMSLIAMGFILTVELLVAYERLVILPAHGIAGEAEYSYGIADSGQTKASISSRVQMWETCYNAIKSNNAHMLGLGGGGCGFYLAESPRSMAGNPHSALLSFFFDFGLVGLFLFLLLMTMLVVKLFRLIKKLQDGTEKNILLTLLSCAISISFVSLTELNYNYIYLWVLAGIGVPVYRIVASKQTVLIEHNRVCDKNMDRLT